MDAAEIYISITEFLNKFDYPGIKALSADEISQILHKNNRCFLTTWIIEKINKKFLENINNIPANEHKQFISNILSLLGACTDSDSLLFMNGELDINQQLDILMTLFTFASECPRGDKFTKLNNIKMISEEELDAICQPPKDYLQKQYYAGHSESVNKGNAVLDNATEDQSSTNGQNKSITAYTNLLQTLEGQLPEIRILAKNLEFATPPDVDKPLYKIPDCVPEMLKEMNQHMDTIHTYINDLVLIQNNQNMLNDEGIFSNLLQTNETDELLKSLENLLSKYKD